MNIKIGKFRIESDRNQLTLLVERKKGTFPGMEAPKEDETTEEVVGYYSNLESCLKALPSRMLMRSDATSLAEVLELLERYRLLIEGALKGA